MKVLELAEGERTDELYLTIHDHWMHLYESKQNYSDLKAVAFDLAVALTALRDSKGEPNGLIAEVAHDALAAYDALINPSEKETLVSPISQ